MAKRHQVQLQQDIQTEEDWLKILEKPGVIVADIYSEWCGPCVSMQPFLKKVKMDVYGDLLVLVTVNCEQIECLSRFRGKSEPTWMFIKDGKMLRVIFGANAQYLMKVMIEELQHESLVVQGKAEPKAGLEFHELTDEEDERYQKDLAMAQEEAAIKLAAEQKIFSELRLQQCEYLLQNLHHVGLILFYPHTGNDGMAAVSEQWDPLGLIVFNLNRMDLHENQIKDLMWYEPEELRLTEEEKKWLTAGQILVLLVRPMTDDFDEDLKVDQLVLQAAYGNERKPPGDPDCPARKVFRPPEEGEPSVAGMWAPSNPLSKAMALETMFPEVCKAHRLPEVEPPPPVLAVIFDARKRKETMEVLKEYPEEILHFGYFTSADPKKTTLIAKTTDQYQNYPAASFADKLVFCVSKKRSDALLSLALHNPVYVSDTTEIGAEDCAIFFPENYDAPPEEDEEHSVKEGKKHKKHEAKHETKHGSKHGDGESMSESEHAPDSVQTEEAQVVEEAKAAASPEAEGSAVVGEEPAPVAAVEEPAPVATEEPAPAAAEEPTPAAAEEPAAEQPATT